MSEYMIWFMRTLFRRILKGRKIREIKRKKIVSPIHGSHLVYEYLWVWYNLPFRYEHLAKSAPTILDDSLSADSYLNVLYMPSTFPRSERSRRSQEAMNSNSRYGSDLDDGPRSNLDSVRYLECVNYLQEVSWAICHLAFSQVSWKVSLNHLLGF